jgi:hypothetical protein
MKPGPKTPPSIDFNSIVIGGGIGLLTLFVPILSVMGDPKTPPLERVVDPINRPFNNK